MEPSKSSGNIAYTPICNADLQERQDEELINLAKSQEYEIELEFSEMPLQNSRILLRLRI